MWGKGWEVYLLLKRKTLHIFLKRKKQQASICKQEEPTQQVSACHGSADKHFLLTHKYI